MDTPEMTQAQRELDGRIDHALGVASRVRARVAEFERKVGPPAPPTDEEIARIKAFVLGHARTNQWQPVLDRIGRGELTWQEVAEGLACGGADRQVTAAFAALAEAPPASVEELVELGIFPAHLPTETQGTEADTATDEDEQWFDENPLGLPNR